MRRCVFLFRHIPVCDIYRATELSLRIKRHGERLPTRSELALTSCFRLLLTLYGRLLVMLALANLSDNAVFCAGTLETLESGIQGLVLTNAYFCHEFFPPFVQRQRLSIKRHRFRCSL